MALYKKKPVVVEARQYRTAIRDDLISWIKNKGGDVIHTGIGEQGEDYELENMRIKTLEGEMTVCIGDWIICGIKGEFYPCKPDIFDATYEPA